MPCAITESFKEYKQFDSILLKGIFQTEGINPHCYTMEFLFAKAEDATEKGIEQVKNMFRQDVKKEISKI
jgi:hypothetical protein